jgi:hypothetical protein
VLKYKEYLHYSEDVSLVCCRVYVEAPHCPATPFEVSSDVFFKKKPAGSLSFIKI